MIMKAVNNVYSAKPAYLFAAFGALLLFGGNDHENLMKNNIFREFLETFHVSLLLWVKMMFFEET